MHKAHTNHDNTNPAGPSSSMQSSNMQHVSVQAPPPLKGPLTKEEVLKMRRACKMAARVLRETGARVEAGVRTVELDEYALALTHKLGGRSACLGYRGFPRAVCVSVNSVICHGVPGDEVLREGDIVNVDVTCETEGFFGDTSAMFCVGSVSEEARKLCNVAREARDKGIEILGPGTTTGDVGFRVNKFVRSKGYAPVLELGGHGIGRNFHEEPFVPSYGKKGRGAKLQPWQCITVEPMVNEEETDLLIEPIEGSEVQVFKTKTGCLSAQWEHTVLITDVGYEVLTA